MIPCSAQPAIIVVYCGHLSGRKMLAEFTKVIVPRENNKSMEILVIECIHGRICLTCETECVKESLLSLFEKHYIVIL